MIGMLAWLACAPTTPPPPPPAPVVDAPAAAWSPPPGLTRLRFALTPYLEPAQLLAEHEPMRAWLSQRLGVPVELRVAGSYDELGALLRSGEVDLGEFSPYAYVRASARDPGLAPLVSQIADGSASAAGYIVVDADSPIQALEELRGRRFAYVDPASTTGFLYAHMLLVGRGLQPGRDFSSVSFLSNHKAVLLAVHEGRVDAGAVYQGALSALERSDGITPLSFRIIGKTSRIPRDLLCTRAGLDPAVRESLRRLLLSVSAQSREGRRILSPMRVNGFVPADDRLYDPIREADAQLQLGE